MEGRARKASTIPNNSTKIEVDLSPSTKKMASPPGLGTAGALTLSVVSSVSIVICNKALMSTFKFNFGKRTSSEIHEYVFLCQLSRSCLDVAKNEAAPAGAPLYAMHTPTGHSRSTWSQVQI